MKILRNGVAQLSLVGRNRRGDVSPCVIYNARIYVVGEKRIFTRSLSLSLFPSSSFETCHALLDRGFRIEPARCGHEREMNVNGVLLVREMCQIVRL